GVKPDYDGISIDPCIPKDWNGFSMSRQFRGATYAITVTNPNHVSKGVKQVIVNGSPIQGTIIPILEAGKTHTVDVIMG
ncbi:MAG TPA: hypothetical protein PLU45_06755, partial [Bacteroidales bacterium]|nr:hypothetical protein [Bacteroidales bacterium]